MRTFYRVSIVSMFAAFLSGCLDAKNKAADSEPDSSVFMAKSVSSLDSVGKCNNGKEGALIYERTEKRFYTCDSGEWVAIDIKGQQGPAGPQGVTGATGATGAAGSNGVNGRDGLDGNGIRLALKENGQIKALLIQYGHEQYSNTKPLALLIFPSGDMIYAEVRTGKFAGRTEMVYFKGPNCTGDAYIASSSELAPHVKGRIFVGLDNSNEPAKYYRVQEQTYGSQTFISRREYSTMGELGRCGEWATTTGRDIVRVSEVSAPPSLSHLAPLTFEP